MLTTPLAGLLPPLAGEGRDGGVCQARLALTSDAPSQPSPASGGGLSTPEVMVHA